MVLEPTTASDTGIKMPDFLKIAFTCNSREKEPTTLYATETAVSPRGICIWITERNST